MGECGEEKLYRGGGRAGPGGEEAHIFLQAVFSPTGRENEQVTASKEQKFTGDALRTQY